MKKFSFALTLIIAIGFTLIFLPQKVAAIPISPDKYYIDTHRGESTDHQLIVFGREQFTQIQSLQVTVVGMHKIGEENEREFYNADPADQLEAANWITTQEQTITVIPGQESILHWTLTPSMDAGCGTNLAAIILSSAPLSTTNEAGSQVNIQREIVSQIHVNITDSNSSTCPDSEAKPMVTEFGLNSSSPIVTDPSNLSFTTKIENTGNLISRSPTGYIDLLGFGPKITIPFNPEGIDVYPGSTHRFDTSWVDPDYPSDKSFFEQAWYELVHLRIGQYEVRLGITKNVTPGIIVSTYIWIFPWKVILVILIIIGLLFTSSKIRNMRNSQKISKFRVQDAK